jgi:flagellar motility protein MotE (MotC chaperone)
MNKPTELAVLAIGGVSFFAVAFIGFAALSGAPLSELAVVGPLFAGDAQPEAASAAPTAAPAPLAAPREGKQALQANLGVLAAFTLEAPFRGRELQQLVDDLKSRTLALDQREARLEDQEGLLRERMDQVAAQFATIESLRAELDLRLKELELRSAEVAREERAADSTRREGLAKLAELFREGDLKPMAARIAQFPPEEAAIILHCLEPERASALLNGLTGEAWKLYSQAYAQAAPAAAPGAGRR